MKPEINKVTGVENIHFENVTVNGQDFKGYKVMNRFVFLLGFLLMALMTVTLQAQKIIPLWQNNMPNSKGIVLKDSVVRNVWYKSEFLLFMFMNRQKPSVPVRRY